MRDIAAALAFQIQKDVPMLPQKSEASDFEVSNYAKSAKIVKRKTGSGRKRLNAKSNKKRKTSRKRNMSKKAG